MTRARYRPALLAAGALLGIILGCPAYEDPTGEPRVPEPPTGVSTPRPTATATAAPTAAPTAPATTEPPRDPRGTRCMACSSDAECRPPLRCFPFTDGRSRCDNANPGPAC